MKHEKILTALWSCILSFLISMASIACLVTAFDMAVELPRVMLWCGIAAVGATACYILPLQLLPISVAALAGGYLWQEGSLRLSIQSLLFRISRQYNSVYGWGTIRLNMYTADDMEQTLWLALCFLGALIAMGVAWSVCRRKTALAGALPATVALALCFVTTQTVPDVPWLYFFLFALLLLMLTHTVRRKEEAQGNRLSFLAALPLALGLLLLFAAVPQDRYAGQALAQDMQTAVLESPVVQAVFGDLTEKGTSGSSVDISTVRLDHVGVRLRSQAQILQVAGDFSGRVYLRGRALDAYDGISWTDSGDSYANLGRINQALLEERGTVTVTTKYAHRTRYVPYYVSEETAPSAMMLLENADKLTEYAYACYQPRFEQVKNRVFDFDTGNYLHLDAAVKKWAEPLARQITQGEDSVYNQAQAIAEYVRKSATYDLNTSRMPERKKDFARWFLEDSDTGYCIHFATATTVLLQAAGIPARYVTGYTATVEAGQFDTVRSEDAHAWAEYWLPGFGWTVLESTPAAQEQAGQTTETLQPIPGDVLPPDTHENSPKTDPVILFIVGVCVVFAAALALLGRYFILHRRQRKKLTQGTAQQQILQRWNMAACTARYLGEMPPQTLLEIAQKAKFSQHTPTDEDMAALDNYLSDNIRRLKEKSLFHRLWYKVILVLY